MSDVEVWISKYALTGGIRRETAKATGSDDLVKVQRPGEFAAYYRLGVDAHKTFSEAAAQAEKARQRKIGSLRKQIERLERLTFEEAAQ